MTGLFIVKVSTHHLKSTIMDVKFLKSIKGYSINTKTSKTHSPETPKYPRNSQFEIQTSKSASWFRWKTVANIISWKNKTIPTNQTVKAYDYTKRNIQLIVRNENNKVFKDPIFNAPNEMGKTETSFWKD